MDNIIHPTAIIGDNVELGTGNEIGAYTVIGHFGFQRSAKSKKGKIIIGNNNRIGNHVNIMAGEEGETTIGDDNMIMNGCNIGHNVQVGDNNEIGVGTMVLGFAKIGNENKIKAHCSIRNRVAIGNNNLIGMGSNVVESIGNYEKWLGNPAHRI